MFDFRCKSCSLMLISWVWNAAAWAIAALTFWWNPIFRLKFHSLESIAWRTVYCSHSANEIPVRTSRDPKQANAERETTVCTEKSRAREERHHHHTKWCCYEWKKIKELNFLSVLLKIKCMKINLKISFSQYFERNEKWFFKCFSSFLIGFKSKVILFFALLFFARAENQV